MAQLIYIVDDEQDIVDLVTLHLEKSNFKVQGFSDAASLYHQLEQKRPSLIVLDLMLPDEGGFEICKYLKKEEKYVNIPIIILSARIDETDKVLGLELGADDYITKPFSPKELVARVRTVLRRSNTDSKGNKIFIEEDFLLDLDKYQLLINKKEIPLTATEFKILQLLSSKAGWVFNREQILDYLWGNEKAILDRTIDVHIKNLRSKMGKKGNLIKNVRGLGYKIEP